MVDAAEISIWGVPVGAVRWDPQNGLASFQYRENFLARGYDLAPLKMPIRNGNRIYSFPELRRNREEYLSTFNGLPGLLADSLPDKYGNQLMDIWLARNGRPPDSMNPVEKLCFIGTRGMGALEYEPALVSSSQSFIIEMKSLVETAQKMLSGREKFRTNIKAEEYRAMGDILKIGTSAGGVRPKAVIVYNRESGEVRSGQSAAPGGFEHWIIKLDGVSDAQFGSSHGFGRVEYAYYLMAKDCGIQMMESELLEENDRAHFMTRRFDREDSNTKHHIQSLCGIQHMDYNDVFSFSYEQLFQVMRMLKLTYPEAEQMYRRMVFNVMARNCDDHTKNFAFRLKQNGRWELAPAYDICYAYDPRNVWVNQQSLSINGKHSDIRKEDLLTLARTNKIRRGEQIIDEIKEVTCNWEAYAKNVEVSSHLAGIISSTLPAFTFN